jgi:hypothetical protein
VEANGIRLLSRSAVEQLLGSGPEFREFLDHFLGPRGPVRRFPNGAVEIDEGRVDSDEFRKAFRSCAVPGCGLTGRYIFKTLGPFEPKRFFFVNYREAYQKQLRSEASFQIGQGRIWPPAPGEFELATLEASVAFRTRTSKGVRRSFVKAISAWAATASERGAFEDGPVSLASQGVEFSGTRARFRIDARCSGQDTLNWLALVILDFGEDVHTVTGVYFGATLEFLDKAMGPVRSEWELVEFPGDRQAPAPESSPRTAPSDFVPPGTKRSSEFASPKFRVLALPYDEWDSFVATIYFGRPLLAEERKELAALIDAWFLLGSYGSLGGTGTHSSNPVKFDETTDSAILTADMGDVDATIALSVLIRALEGFEAAGAPIDALVFGQPGLPTIAPFGGAEE